MTSIFFQISRTDFLEASRIHQNYNKQFALRIVSLRYGIETFVYLPEVTLNELSILANIFQVIILPDIRSLDQLKRSMQQYIYYY